MLFLVTGASGAGKTACMPHLRQLLPEMPLHDFDERGVPDNADKAWRQQQTENWVQHALAYEAQGQAMILCGQVILGEALACPSASLLQGVASCLLDCYDVERIRRLRGRGTHGATQDMLSWAAWQRMHAVDPQWRPDVIRDGGWSAMHWERWRDWQAGDSRWQTWVLDTTALGLEAVAEQVASWVVGYSQAA